MIEFEPVVSENDEDGYLAAVYVNGEEQDFLCVGSVYRLPFISYSGEERGGSRETDILVFPIKLRSGITGEFRYAICIDGYVPGPDCHYSGNINIIGLKKRGVICAISGEVGLVVLPWSGPDSESIKEVFMNTKRKKIS